MHTEKQVFSLQQLTLPYFYSSYIMEDGHFCVYYKTLPLCKVHFTVQAELAVFVELLDGYARIHEDDGTINNLSERERYLLQSLCPTLLSISGCIFKVYGRHVLYSREWHRSKVLKRMFQLLDQYSTVQFVFEKNFQITVFNREETRPAIMDIDHHDHQVFGPVLHFETQPQNRYYLPPFSHFLIKTKNGKYNSCSIRIYQPVKNFDFFISPYNDVTFTNIKAVLLNIRSRYKSKKATDFPKILVLGNRSVTKISFCHSIFNDAFKNGLKLVYVDLNVRENSNGIPGSVRIIQVSGYRTVDDRGCHKSEVFLGNDESVFSFGYVDPGSNIKLYYLLLNKLADLASQMNEQESAGITGTVIDMCESLSNDLIAVRRAIDAFHINAIVVVGNEELHQNLRRFDLHRCSLQRFIPEAEDFQPPSSNLHSSIIREYVRWAQNVFPIKFSDIKICEIISEGVANNIESSTVFNLEDVRTVLVACGEHLENHLLGVSECSTEVQELPVTGVKYFVYILKVDMEKEILHLKSPKAECPSGAILIKGDIKLLAQNES